MRIRDAIFASIVVALASQTAPALAKHPEVKNSEVTTPSEPSASWHLGAVAVSGTGFPAATPA
jgi:hypothetical protein